jgi:hypothetical protein
VSSILLPWVENIGLRHQGVLVSAMRGCDLAPRHDPSKLIQRLLRGAVLMPHCGRFANPKTYIMSEPDEDKWWNIVRPFLRSWDHYPNHYVIHFIHATEIVGYHGPTDAPIYSDRWESFYILACNALHMNPETKSQLEYRLNLEEEEFYAQQENR